MAEKEFKINKFLTLRLLRGKPIIYVNNKRFRQCRFLLLINPHKRDVQTQINSIDEASELLRSELERDIKPQDLGLDPEQVFWGHCSNLQVWTESGYDTRMIHSNLAFPLLKKLTEVGDPQAKKAFKDEIAKRFLSGYIPVAIYLMDEGYLEYLNDEEFDTLIEEFSVNIANKDNNYGNNDLANAWNNLSLVLCKRGRLDGAIKASKQAIKLRDSYSKAWNNLGYIYNESGEYEKAMESLGKALDLTPDYFLAWNNLAVTYIGKEDYENAVIASTKSLELAPDFPNAMCHLGFAYHKLGDVKRGTELIEKGLSIKGDYQRGWQYLKRIRKETEVRTN